MTQKPNRKSRVASTAAPRRESAWREWIVQNRGWLATGAGTAAIVGTALYNRASAQRAERQTPPAGKFVEVDGVRLHYLDRGEGAVVVLLHGDGVMLQDFEVSGVLSLAAEQHRVIAFDRPGYGYSERPRSTVWTPAAQAELIAKALIAIGVDRAVVVGHSWGTLVALSMALDHPGVVSALVLLSGYYYGTARPDVISGSVPAIPLVGDLLTYTVGPLLGVLSGSIGVRASFAPAPVSPKFADFPKALALRPSQIHASSADAALMVPSALAVSRRYGELTLPVIIMAGRGDLIVHIDKHAERLVGDIKEAELRIVPDQGHMLHYAVPEQVVAAIGDVEARAR
ncbi:2-hydroxymuconate semialdehyde hydrolase [Sphingomonas mucosissima]|uniref:2-hydroxymuconate semialdehyde hydrolase n=2 Tax=Sphingomonas mucosissima TaxID=370959 RepID=A0A245ZJK8_9SPHN|nr:2-hydroxymuconate semialdehyde hydrolase [Sphingomonas mucosissima]